jgi:hypothetical protein
MADPALSEVMARIDRQFEVLGLELRAVRAEMSAGFAELRVDVAALRQTILDLDKSMRELWGEHLGHTHPDEAP